MSPSMLVCEGRHGSFRDSDLFAVVAVLEYLLEKGELDVGLAPTIAAWRSELGRSGPGTIDLGLDTIAAESTTRRRLADALMYVADRAAGVWNDAVPPSVLNRFEPFQVKFFDYTVSDIQHALRRLHRLLG